LARYTNRQAKSIAASDFVCFLFLPQVRGQFLVGQQPVGHLFLAQGADALEADAELTGGAFDSPAGQTLDAGRRTAFPNRPRIVLEQSQQERGRPAALAAGAPPTPK
jgi:hypothetical protein